VGHSLNGDGAEPVTLTFSEPAAYRACGFSYRLSGRADVILDRDNGEVRSLAIVDYKTSADPAARDDYELQLAIYADAGLREGLPIEAAYVHDLKAADRQPVDVAPAAITASEQTVEASVAGLRQRIFHASPGPRCRRCDVHSLCRWSTS
jgi:RecB family exonuclease